MTRLNMTIWKMFLEAFLNAQNGSQLSRLAYNLSYIQA